MPRQGESLGKYKLVRRIGMGGMAEVWQAKVSGPAGFSKNLVVKTVLEHHTQNEEFVAQFFDEARLAALLNHPNIAQIFELGDHSGIYYIAMEYVRGRDLQELRKVAVERQGGLPFPILARIGCGVCEGLHYAHELCDESGKALNLVHRDVSPENILISFDGVVKIVDFGIAKATITQVTTRAGLFKGKLQYAAPQRLLNLPIDRRDDIYSLGGVLYKAATGQTPIQADSDGAMVKKILDADFAKPREVEPTIPEELEQVILKCMEWDPVDRYQSAREVQRDLERYIAATGQPVTTFEVSQFMRKCFAEELERASTADAEALSEVEAEAEVEAEPSGELARGDKPQGTVFGLGGQQRGVANASKTRIGHVIDDKPALPVPPEHLRRDDQEPGEWRPRGRLTGVVGLIGVLLLLAAGIAIGAWAPWRPEPDAAIAQQGTALTPDAREGEAGPRDGSPAPRPAADAASAPGDAAAADTSSADAAVAAEAGSDGGDDAGDEPAPTKVDVSMLAPPEVPRGTLSLRGPSGCTAQLGEASLGELPVESQLPVGEHEIVVRCGHGIRRDLQVTLREGETTTEVIHFREGTLHVLVRPWAEVYINNRKVGITPMAPISLTEGRYSVRLVNSELNVSKTTSVRIRPGQQTTLRERLR